MTAEDVKFTVEQNLKPDSQGGSAPFFRAHLERIETPDKHTVVMHFKNRVWEVPSNFTQFVGYQNITSKKYIESVGEDKAALHPIGTGPFRHVEGKQGDYHRFEAVANHWRKTPAFKELVVRRIPDPATRLAGLRSGEIDIGHVFGDYLDQAKKAGLRIHETPNAACHWVVLQGQTTPDREDYCPTCPWAGDPADPKSLDNARKVRLALNLAVNKKTIVSALWKGLGSDAPFMYWYYPFHKGYSRDWKMPAVRPRARQEAPGRGGARRRLRGPDESAGDDLRPRRPRHGRGGRARLGKDRHQGAARSRSVQQLPAEEPRAQDQQDPLGLRLAALRRAGPRLAALPSPRRAPSTCSATAPTTRTSTRSRASSTPTSARG